MSMTSKSSPEPSPASRQSTSNRNCRLLRPMSVGIVYHAHTYPPSKRRGLLHHERKCKIDCGPASE
ncbi:hypothetical protein SCLCIDRAFT_1220239 [Scleroderma citrinum Foug A]|uniref:Uncharacterized protein n=1 Tax=Scleroderma citrinum Foug A TaxID=1036808 RepID=A0A0C3D702_9AGAM|nr:hypothetical protein SCLCIDRAFT_1220239 [Scleroderma citrinum Foug A]